jgi:membrane-bound metal-dependent hydrolase YbcI (DUF457 family)
VLVFCHLFIGVVLGLLLYQWTGRRWMVPVIAFGAILPDLIDKPLGHLLLQGSLDFGRIFAHSLLFLGLLVIAAAVLWKARSSLLLAAVALGVGTHLVLDAMWDLPISLFWPLLGPFQAGHFPDYFASSFVVEVTSPLEWMFGLLVVSILVMLYRDRLGHIGVTAARALEPLQLPMLAFLLILGALTMATGAVTSLSNWVDGQNLLIEGACAVVGGAYLMRRELRRPSLKYAEPYNSKHPH